jgi:hypothetical protein
MNDRLNNAIERLLLDDRFLRRFRCDPERALEPYELTDAEVAAVTSGDARQLLQMGLDSAYVWPRQREGFLHAWIVRHVKRLTPALVLAAFVLPAAPALAARRVSGRQSPVARVSRYFGQRSFGGRFHARLARAGLAGRMVSRAATGRNVRTFNARARASARDFGIKPPPGTGSEQ